MIATLLDMLTDASKHGNKVEFSVALDTRAEATVRVKLTNAWQQYEASRKVGIDNLTASVIPATALEECMRVALNEVRYSASKVRNA